MPRTWSRITSLAVLAALTALPLIATPALAAPAPAERVAFVRYNLSTQRTSLVTMEPTGKKQKTVRKAKVTAESDIITSAALSPDGERLLFTKGFGFTKAEIWTAKANGKQAKAIVKLAGDKTAFSPSWSPDGKKIVYVESDDATYSALVVAKANGKGRKQIHKNTKNLHFHPTWSPDGKRILFSTSNSPSSPIRVGSVKAGGGGVKWLTKPAKGYCLAGDWSPDSARVVYTCIKLSEPDPPRTTAFEATASVLALPRGVGGVNVFTAKANGKGSKKISESDDQVLGTARFTPDGTRIITTLLKGESADLFSRSIKGTGGWKRLTKTDNTYNVFDFGQIT